MAKRKISSVPAPHPEQRRDANLLGLILACKDEPESDDLRGILADYLEDHNEPERAEFQRLSSLEDSASTQGRLARLWGEHADNWFTPPPMGRARIGFRRGWVTVRTQLSQLREAALRRWLTSVGPWLDRLRLEYTQQNAIARLPELPEVAHFTTLELLGSGLYQEKVRSIAQGSLAENLRGLTLTLAASQPRALEPIVEPASKLFNLRELSLTGPVSDRALQMLTTAPFARHLRVLRLPYTKGQARILGRAPALHHLRSLTYTEGPLWEEGLTHLLGPGNLANLGELHLHAGVGEDDLRALAEWPGLARLEALSLGYWSQSETGLHILLASPHLTNLRRLVISPQQMDSAIVEALVNCESLPRLESLALSDYIGWNPSVMLPVCEAHNLPALRDLTLAMPELDQPSLEALLQGPLARNLRRLCLRPARFGHLVRALAEVGHLPALEALDLTGWNVLDSAALRVLTRSQGLKQLMMLEIGLSDSGEMALPELAAGNGMPALKFLRVQSHNRPLNVDNIVALANSPRRAKGFYFDVDGPSAADVPESLRFPFERD